MLALHTIRLPAFFAVLLAVAGCGGPMTEQPANEQADPVSFVAEGAPIQFTFPAGWELSPKAHKYQLYCKSSTHDLSTGVFIYTKAELPADLSVTDVFRKQFEKLSTKLSDIEEIETLVATDYEDKTVSTVTYQANVDDSRSCIRYSLIEFTENPTAFAIVVQVTAPEDWEANKPICEAITQSATQLAAGQ